MTHPPGQPDGPTGPGRAIPAGPTLDEADEILNLHHDRIGEPHQHSTPPCTCGHDGLHRMFHLAPCPRSERGDRVPSIAEVGRDTKRYLDHALAVLERGVDPASIPYGNADLVSFWRDSAGFHIEAALRDLASLADVSLPPVGSAVRPPVVREEGAGAVVASGANTGPSPSAAPVAPGRGVGPGLLGPGELLCGEGDPHWSAP